MTLQTIGNHNLKIDLLDIIQGNQGLNIFTSLSEKVRIYTKTQQTNYTARCALVYKECLKMLFKLGVFESDSTNDYQEVEAERIYQVLVLNQNEVAKWMELLGPLVHMIFMNHYSEELESIFIKLWITTRIYKPIQVQLTDSPKKKPAAIKPNTVKDYDEDNKDGFKLKNLAISTITEQKLTPTDTEKNKSVKFQTSQEGVINERMEAMERMIETQSRETHELCDRFLKMEETINLMNRTQKDLIRSRNPNRFQRQNMNQQQPFKFNYIKSLQDETQLTNNKPNTKQQLQDWNYYQRNSKSNHQIQQKKQLQEQKRYQVKQQKQAEAKPKISDIVKKIIETSSDEERKTPPSKRTTPRSKKTLVQQQKEFEETLLRESKIVGKPDEQKLVEENQINKEDSVVEATVKIKEQQKPPEEIISIEKQQPSQDKPQEQPKQKSPPKEKEGKKSPQQPLNNTVPQTKKEETKEEKPSLVIQEVKRNPFTQIPEETQLIARKTINEDKKIVIKDNKATIIQTHKDLLLLKDEKPPVYRPNSYPQVEPWMSQALKNAMYESLKTSNKTAREGTLKVIYWNNRAEGNLTYEDIAEKIMRVAEVPKVDGIYQCVVRNTRKYDLMTCRLLTHIELAETMAQFLKSIRETAEETKNTRKGMLTDEIIRQLDDLVKPEYFREITKKVKKDCYFNFIAMIVNYISTDKSRKAIILPTLYWQYDHYIEEVPEIGDLSKELGKRICERIAKSLNFAGKPMNQKIRQDIYEIIEEEQEIQCSHYDDQIFRTTITVCQDIERNMFDIKESESENDDEDDDDDIDDILMQEYLNNREFDNQQY
ncbi:UNKNOWN [Stylonychia lemnae]|uniref:Uncharacterized protein n=1 Tax=Stylonychia lemnae TaxID=5949 RepID=A0A078A858_STYLE|nr:UNKNOWN [Stylonychia lemnae]|eukprot:CDW78404.1 UNKNOWN [Stylonychia lemnae]